MKFTSRGRDTNKIRSLHNNSAKARKNQENKQKRHQCFKCAPEFIKTQKKSTNANTQSKKKRRIPATVTRESSSLDLIWLELFGKSNCFCTFWHREHAMWTTLTATFNSLVYSSLSFSIAQAWRFRIKPRKGTIERNLRDPPPNWDRFYIT